MLRHRLLRDWSVQVANPGLTSWATLSRPFGTPTLNRAASHVGSEELCPPSSKSVSCFQTLQQLAPARTPVTVTTRLQTYTNMVLIAIHAPDDNRTKHGLRATLTFERIFTASISVNNPNWSARPNETSQFVGGTISSTPVPYLVGHSRRSLEPPPISANQVTGAGNWSSNPGGS